MTDHKVYNMAGIQSWYVSLAKMADDRVMNAEPELLICSQFFGLA